MYHSIIDHAVCLPALDHVSTYFESLTTAPQVGTITISLGQRCHFSRKYRKYLQSEIGIPTCDGLHMHTCGRSGDEASIDALWYSCGICRKFHTQDGKDDEYI